MEAFILLMFACSRVAVTLYQRTQKEIYQLLNWGTDWFVEEKDLITSRQADNMAILVYSQDFRLKEVE